MALDMGFLDLRRGGETGAQRMAGKRQASFALRKIAANAGGERGFLHQTSDMLVGEAFGADAGVLLASGGTRGRERSDRAASRSRAWRPGRWRGRSRGRFRPRASRSCR